MIGILRIAAIVLLFYLIYRVLKGWGTGGRNGERRKQAESRKPEELVQDPVSRVYFPRSHGIASMIAGRIVYFQNKENRDAYLREHSGSTRRGDRDEIIFIDTANLQEIQEADSMGLLDGVTTNPTLIAREGVDRDQRIKEICEIVNGPVSAEVLSVEADGMIAEGKLLAKMADNIAVKVPMTVDGIKASKALSGEGIMVNMTLVFSPIQALLAAKAGATFVSPFVGRLDDIATNGMELVDQIVTIYNNYGYETEVLVASVRHPIHVLESAMMGADVITMPFKVIKQLASHPLTDKGLAAFLDDYKKSQKK